MPVDETVVDIDIDAQEGQLREAAGKPTSVRLFGKVLEIEPPEAWGEIALGALNEGDLSGWLDEVVDEKTLAEVRDAGEIKLYHLKAIFEKVNETAGLDSGKSNGSSRRSKPTRKR